MKFSLLKSFIFLVLSITLTTSEAVIKNLPQLPPISNFRKDLTQYLIEQINAFNTTNDPNIREQFDADICRSLTPLVNYLTRANKWLSWAQIEETLDSLQKFCRFSTPYDHLLSVVAWACIVRHKNLWSGIYTDNNTNIAYDLELLFDYSLDINPLSYEFKAQVQNGTYTLTNTQTKEQKTGRFNIFIYPREKIVRLKLFSNTETQYPDLIFSRINDLLNNAKEPDFKLSGSSNNNQSSYSIEPKRLFSQNQKFYGFNKGTKLKFNTSLQMTDELTVPLCIDLEISNDCSSIAHTTLTIADRDEYFKIKEDFYTNQYKTDAYIVLVQNKYVYLNIEDRFYYLREKANLQKFIQQKKSIAAYEGKNFLIHSHGLPRAIQIHYTNSTNPIPNSIKDNKVVKKRNPVLYSPY